MSVEAELKARASSQCELCSAGDALSVYEITPRRGSGAESAVLLCAVCRERIVAPASGDVQHWYCLRDSMWSEHGPVKVAVYRILKALGDHPLAQELLGQIYLDDETQAWADATESSDDAVVVRDSNGTVLQAGDAVTLIKDLEVKGANFTAKRGTSVKSIVLTGDPRYVEGRVNGMTIVLVAAYLKKA